MLFILGKVELKTSISFIVAVAKNPQVTFIEKLQYKIKFLKRNRGGYVIYYIDGGILEITSAIPLIRDIGWNLRTLIEKDIICNKDLFILWIENNNF